MFKKILLPLDLEDKHRQAIKTAIELARQNKGEVTLLHVIEVIPGLSRNDEKEFYDRLERAARVRLGRQLAHFSREKIPCTVEVIFGPRAPDTARWAREHGMDVIVLTAPHFQPDHAVSVLGSMTWKISVIASCPVLVVRNSAATEKIN
jgi:nucleotide-binding universal stress UspA family protein